MFLPGAASVMKPGVPLKVYQYEKCDTCRRALKFLAARGVVHTSVPIREQPPSRMELTAMLKVYGGEVIREPWEVPGVGRIAIVNDNAGNSLGWMTPSE